MKNIIFILAIALIGCKSDSSKSDNAGTETAKLVAEETDSQNTTGPEIIPVSHATMVLNWNGTVIYIDPVGGAASFEGQPSPDLVLITDIHGDHLNKETIEAIVSSDVIIGGPEAVTDELGGIDAKIEELYNGNITTLSGISVEAVPMYNLREEALQFHTKGRGNGYVLEKDGTRIYISGDTEDIPEMRNLKNIDIAFVCMNLPYTMTVESAASAVLEFKPKKVYPYHYRGTEGLSDVNKFKELVNEGDQNLEVVQLNWYPSK